jgi:hypothetical protein
LEQTGPISILKNYVDGNIPFKCKSNITGKQHADAAVSDIDGLLGEIHVFLQLRFTGLFGGNRLYLSLQTWNLPKVFLSKRNQFSLGNYALDATPFKEDACLWRDTCVTSAQMNRIMLN